VGVIAGILVALVAAVHVYIVVLEMFLWKTPRGQKAFGLTPEFAEQTAVLAANQGLYNGFLAAGLFWGLVAGNFGAKVFFLVCVMVAGLYVAATASKKILFVQTVPATLALLFVFLAR
jgi:putative membrane protein